MTCQTFTHHVGEGIRVECIEHGVVVDVPPQPRGARSTRALATDAQVEHEAGAQQ